MPSAPNSRPSPEAGTSRVAAPTLAEALRQARAIHGEDACVVDSRVVLVKDEGGLGQRRLIEVLVAPPGAHGRLAARPARRPSTGRGDVTAALAGEVERVEQLVAAITAGRRPPGGPPDYPLATALLRAGASRVAVERCAASFRNQPGSDPGDSAAAAAHLRAELRTSAGDWTGFGGCHLFLGESGSGKTDLVLGTAARLRSVKLRPLVLSLLPRHGGEIRRLQLEASRQGYDAAVMHRPEQLAANAAHFGGYDAVLIDTPSLFARSLNEPGDLRQFTTGEAAFHRHLVVAADADLQERAELWEAARHWNCDWTAVTRLDRSRKPGKLLDLLARVPWPFSLVTAGAWPERMPDLARGDDLLRRVLGAESAECPAGQGRTAAGAA